MNQKKAISIWRRLFRWTLVLVLVAGAGFLIWRQGRPKPVEVVVKPVTRGTVERTVSNTRAGTVKACRRAKLSPNIGGQISTLAVSKGDRVKEGDLLVELWNEDLKAQILVAEREVEVAKSRLQSMVSRAESSRRSAGRLVKLQRSKAVADDQVDTAVTESDALTAEAEAARVQVKAAEARLALTQASYGRTLLMAPFDGVIAEINGELFEYVTPSPLGIATPPIIDIISGDCFYVIAPIDEVDVADVRQGMPARISLDAQGSKRFPGLVRRISDYVLDVEKQARTVDVEVNFDRPEEAGRLLAGYSADLEIILEERRDVVRAPAEAVIEGRKVYVFKPAEGRVVLREIKIGLANWDQVEVLDGLAPDELLVVNVDKPELKDGAKAVRAEEQD
jgi:HlyD family secretion protein